MKKTKFKSLAKDKLKTFAFRFIILIGIVSFFADITYEGSRSITGPYLATLGASATLVGFVAGLGELIGYGLRFASGYLLDRTKAYWPIAVLGYLVNLLAVPALALTTHWLPASCLIVLERAGKAVRIPARDAMISHAAHRLGSGKAFGIHGAFDQAGAMFGPLIISLTLYLGASYQHAFGILLIPALSALTVLIITSSLYPHPRNLEKTYIEIKVENTNQIFWLYILGCSLVACGYADFALIAYHFQKNTSFAPDVIPLVYALSMGVSCIASYGFGHWYDLRGPKIQTYIVFITAFSSIFVFMEGTVAILFGMALWGLGMGAQNSLMRALIANIVPADKRGSAYGMFNMLYGIAWFMGSFIMGILYDISVIYLILFSVIVQLCAIPFLIACFRKFRFS